jgi:hypothetical protein
MPAQMAPRPATGGPAPVIESASATTSPDNANSGNTAYIVFGIAALVVTLLFFAFFNLMSAAFEAMSQEIIAQGGDHPIAYDLDNTSVNVDYFDSNAQEG